MAGCLDKALGGAIAGTRGGMGSVNQLVLLGLCSDARLNEPKYVGAAGGYDPGG